MPELTSAEILDQLQPIFQEALEQPALTVTRTSNASNTPRWDSLAHIDIIEMVEQRFHVRFALGELQDLKEVGDLIDLVLAKQARRA